MIVCQHAGQLSVEGFALALENARQLSGLIELAAAQQFEKGIALLMQAGG